MEENRQNQRPLDEEIDLEEANEVSGGSGEPKVGVHIINTSHVGVKIINSSRSV